MKTIDFETACTIKDSGGTVIALPLFDMSLALAFGPNEGALGTYFAPASIERYRFMVEVE